MFGEVVGLSLKAPCTFRLRRTATGIDGETGEGGIVRQYVRGLLGGLQDGSLAEARQSLAECGIACTTVEALDSR